MDLQNECNDIPVNDSSTILRAVSYIPKDHEIGSGNDDEVWIDEQNERNVFTFSFDDEDF